MNLINLNRGDNGGYRELIPGLMLRLDLDQNCYDFIKFYLSTKPNHNWNDPSAPWLDSQGADVFEEPTFVQDDRIMVLPMVVCLLTLKMKLFLDLKVLQTCSSVEANGLDTETTLLVQQNVLQSPIIKGNMQLLQKQDYNEMLLSLKAQMTRLYKVVDKMNKFFWPSILKMDYPPLPRMYSPCSQEEAYLVMHYTAMAILGIPDAFALIRSLSQQ